MIKDARNNGRKKWVHRPPWTWLATCFSLAVPPPETSVSLMQFIKSQHEEDTFGAHSEGMPHMPQFWRSTIETYCIWFHRTCSSLDHKVEQVCKDNWSLWISVCDVTMSITNLHGLSVDFEKPTMFFQQPARNPQQIEVFFSPKNFHLQLLANFGLFSNLSHLFGTWGKATKGQAPQLPTPQSRHPFVDTSIGVPGLEMRIGMVIVEIVEVVVFFWQLVYEKLAELNWNMKFVRWRLLVLSCVKRQSFFFAGRGERGEPNKLFIGQFPGIKVLINKWYTPAVWWHTLR